MSVLKRTPAAPSELLDNVRAAQAKHAQDVAAANARLVSAHRSVFSEVNDRRSAITEQIKLLRAEHDGLDKVAEVSDPAKVTKAGQ